MNPPPGIDPAVLEKAANWKKVLWVSIGGMIAAVVLGIGGTVFSMVRAFDTMGLSGGSNPQALAGSISVAVWTGLGGMTLALISVIPLIVSLCMLSYLKRSAKHSPPPQP